MAAAAGVGADGQLKVLGSWASPFVHRVRVALHLKVLHYENVEEDLTNKSELLLASNPVHKKVPVLLHGGRPVPESLIILEYLDDAFPGAGASLLPADAYDRSVARFWAAYVDGKLHGLMVTALIGATEEERAAATAGTFAALETLEGAFAECSGGKGFFAGDAPGYLDVAFGDFVGWLRAWDRITGVTLLDAGRTPLLAAWAERFAALDAAKGVNPEPEHIAEFAKVLQHGPLQLRATNDELALLHHILKIGKEEEEQMRGKMHPVSASDCSRLKYFEGGVTTRMHICS